MGIDAWVTVSVTLAAGFGVWMFRIDRIATRLESKLDDMHNWRRDTTELISGHSQKLDHHSDRIARLETRVDHQQGHT